MARLKADPGATIGRKLSEVLADSHVRIRAALAPAEAAAASRAVTAHLEQMEREMTPFAKAMFGRLAADPAIPEEVRTVFAEVTEPGHQIGFLLHWMTLLGAVGAIAGAEWAPFVEDLRADRFAANPTVPTSVEILAENVQRGFMSYDEGEHWARRVGIDTPGWDRHLQLAGHPPDAGSLIAAWRRGLIPQDLLDEGLADLGFRPGWIDVLKELQYQPPGPETVVEAVVQNHLTDDEGRTKARQAGLDPSNFDWLYELAGNPPGNEHMIDLMHRGVLTRAQVEQGMREGRLKNKYIAAMIDGGHHLIPMRSVVSAISKGVITKDKGVAMLLQLGFSPENAATLASEATADKVAGSKDLARTQVTAGYEDRMLTRAKAHGMLVGLGYDDTEADFVLDLADHDRDRKFSAAAVGRIHTVFVRRRLPRVQASSALDRLGVPPDQRDDLLRLWDLEREADTPDLSPAQWQGLLRRGIIDEARFTAEMVAKGYTDEEAAFLVPLAYPPSAFGPA